MTLDLFAAGTVLPAPIGARVVRNVLYYSDEAGPLQLDLYLPHNVAGRHPCVLLVSGDASEEVISHAKDWGVYRSYGEHLAARGIAGVAFDHHSSRSVGRAGVAREVAAAITYVREHGSDLEIDLDRVGVWVFSAGGPFALPVMLRDRPPFLRAIAGFYTIWDLAPFGETGGNDWSPIGALGASAQGLPPIFIASAGRDRPSFTSGTKNFVERARQIGADVRPFVHPTGQHGFDIRDDDERSREIIGAALEFFASTLEVRSR